MKRILLIHTGGTFGMAPIDPGDILAPGGFQAEILNTIPEIRRLADIDVVIPFNLDSSNIGINQWDEIAKLIFDNKDAYDGFVIIHGTDTMVYTASALSFSLRNFAKPVVLTGAQRPLSKLRNDAYSNLIDSVEVAALGIPETIIVFGQRILRANRAKKLSTSSYPAERNGRIQAIHLQVSAGIQHLYIQRAAGYLCYFLYQFLPMYRHAWRKCKHRDYA